MTAADAELKSLLARVAEALERLSPPTPPSADLGSADAFVWHADGTYL